MNNKSFVAHLAWVVNIFIEYVSGSQNLISCKISRYMIVIIVMSTNYIKTHSYSLKLNLKYDRWRVLWYNVAWHVTIWRKGDKNIEKCMISFMDSHLSVHFYFFSVVAVDRDICLQSCKNVLQVLLFTILKYVWFWNVITILFILLHFFLHVKVRNKFYA